MYLFLQVVSSNQQTGRVDSGIVQALLIPGIDLCWWNDIAGDKVQACPLMISKAIHCHDQGALDSDSVCSFPAVCVLTRAQVKQAQRRDKKDYLNEDVVDLSSLFSSTQLLDSDMPAGLAHQTFISEQKKCPDS